MKPVRILLVDDHRLFSSGLRLLLGRAAGLQVLGEAPDGATALEMCAGEVPDIAVIDIHLSGSVDGIEVARQLRARHPSVKVLFLSSDADSGVVRRAIEAGAKGYLLKESAPDDLLRAIQAVRGGQFFLASEVAAAVVEDYRQHLAGEPAAKASQLSARERQVLPLLVEGLHNKEIAEKLGVSVKSVETYRARLMEKLHIKSTAELVRYAIREGLVKA